MNKTESIPWTLISLCVDRSQGKLQERRTHPGQKRQIGTKNPGKWHFLLSLPLESTQVPLKEQDKTYFVDIHKPSLDISTWTILNLLFTWGSSTQVPLGVDSKMPWSSVGQLINSEKSLVLKTLLCQCLEDNMQCIVIRESEFLCVMIKPRALHTLGEGATIQLLIQFKLIS